MKHKPGRLQEHTAVLILTSGDEEQRTGEDGLTEKKRKKKQRRESASPQEHVAHVSVAPPGELTQSQKKPKKKRRPDEDEEVEEEEVCLLPTAEPMQHQHKKKKKKKRNGEEPPTVVDVDTPKKKFKDMKEEEICLLSPDGPKHRQKKKKKKKRNGEEPPTAVDVDTPKKKFKDMKEEICLLSPDGPKHRQKKKKKEEVEVTSQQEDEDQIAVAAVPPNIDKALNISSAEKKKKKKRGKTVTKEEKKKKRKEVKLTSSQEEEVDGALVEELQVYLPHIKMKCFNQIKKMLVWDLHRFRRFQRQGVAARLGRFSEQENQKIRENVADFMALTGIGSPEKLLFPHRFQEEKQMIAKLKREHGFMEKIADGIPRPCQQVYLRALKMFDPRNHKGRFSEEELASLVKLHTLHGNNWKLIAQKMDRSIYSLQKRFSTIGVDRGAWSGEEEKRLKQAVKEHLQTLVGDGSPGSGLSRDQLGKQLPWQEISQKLQTRSWIQCRTKWLSLLAERLAWYGKVFTRGPEGYEAKIRLIRKLYNTSVEDIADINWEEVAQAVGEVTAWSVQRMFYRLKRLKVPHAHSLSYGETIDFLYHRVVPDLKKKLNSYTSWTQRQKQRDQDRYQLSDIFYSDVEDGDEEKAKS